MKWDEYICKSEFNFCPFGIRLSIQLWINYHSPTVFWSSDRVINSNIVKWISSDFLYPPTIKSYFSSATPSTPDPVQEMEGADLGSIVHIPYPIISGTFISILLTGGGRMWVSFHISCPILNHFRKFHSDKVSYEYVPVSDDNLD